MTDQLPLPAPRAARPSRRPAWVWCGVTLAGLALPTIQAARAPGGEPPRSLPTGPLARAMQPPPPPPTPAPAPTAIEPLPPPGPDPIEAGAASARPAAGGMPDDLIRQVAEPTAEIEVIIGRSKIIEGKRPLGRVVVANPSVADIQLLDEDQPNPRLLNIYGRMFGATNLTFWDEQDQVSNYLVRVVLDAPDLERRIKQIYPGAEIRVRQVGFQVVLEGQVPDAKTMADVLLLVSNTLLGNAAGAPSTGGAGPVGGGAAPPGGPTGGGAPPTAGAGGGASMAAGGAVPPPGTIVNRVHVPGPRQVMLHVKIAELNRTALRQIGVSWLDTRNEAILGSTIGGAGSVGANGASVQASRFVPGAFTQGAFRAPGVIEPVRSAFDASGAAASAAASQLFGIFNAGEFNLFINALRQNQLAKILAEPNLMALDGQPARFLAGGSFPFPVPQTSVGGAGAAVTIQFRDFGAIIQFLPHILANDVIRLDVAPSFSELNPATGVTVLGTTVPGINQREARTVVELREGQTLAIAGLLQTRTNAATSRIPILGDIPVVGPWFSKNDITTVETELVVLVTPELVAPMEKCDVPPAPGDRVRQPNDYEFYFLGRIEGKTGHPFRATISHHDPLDVMKHFASENRWVVGPHGHAD